MKWSDDELQMLARAYSSAAASDSLKLADLAKRLGRDKANVCRKARQLGLTNQSRPKVAQTTIKEGPRFANQEERSIAVAAWIKESHAKNGHPRVAMGMRHTQEAKDKMRAATIRAWADKASKFNSAEFKQRASDAMLANIVAGKMNEGYSRARGGRRADLENRYFRSAWEANYARYLNLLVQRGEIAGWEFESKTFVFESIKRGTRAYTPDFKVNALDGGHVWHEVKGWMDQKSRTRLARMAKYFPGEKIIVVDSAWFKSANKTLAGVIPHWESGTTR